MTRHSTLPSWFVVLPDTVLQPSQGCCYLASVSVDFYTHGQVIVGNRHKVGEVVNHLKHEIVVGDDRWYVHFIAQHVGFLNADSNTKVFKEKVIWRMTVTKVVGPLCTFLIAPKEWQD